MADFFGLFGNNDENKQNDDLSQDSNNLTNAENNTQSTDSGTLHLHQEELDISKNSTNAGEVVLSKEIVEEKKAVDVPVTHEEVIIERRSLNNQPSNDSIGTEEIIRIPVREEHVEVNKHVVETEEVTAYKRAIEETQHIEEMIKKEEARINKTGDANIISDVNKINTTDTDDDYSGFLNHGNTGLLDNAGTLPTTDINSDTSNNNGNKVANTNDPSITELVDNNYNGEITPS